MVINKQKQMNRITELKTASINKQRIYKSQLPNNDKIQYLIWDELKKIRKLLENKKV